MGISNQSTPLWKALLFEQRLPWRYKHIIGRIKDFRLYKSPILIGGCGRSGTTLLTSILSSHPKIALIPHETGIFCPTG